jgi:aminoglycoside phosphotransferase family enzyme
MSNDPSAPQGNVPIEAKVTFLKEPRRYPAPAREVVLRETRMSWVFLTDRLVYKLKKPLRTDVLDFSTLARREAACRAEFRLNRRLAPGTYLDVKPLSLTESGLAIGGDGHVVDWLVVMRRLDEHLMLDAAIREGRIKPRDVDRLAEALADFFRHARHVPGVPQQRAREWQRLVAFSWRALVDPRLSLPAGIVRNIGPRLMLFLSEHQDLLIQREYAGHRIDGHGDLRPEHIWLGEPLQIIDCLEFNPKLRALDPLSEIAFLDLECERLGAGWVGRRIQRGVFTRLPGLWHDGLFRFYRAYHAIVRARLAITHLLEPRPRTPEKWRPQALSYLKLAGSDTARLPTLGQKTRRSANDSLA